MAAVAINQNGRVGLLTGESVAEILDNVANSLLSDINVPVDYMTKCQVSEEIGQESRAETVSHKLLKITAELDEKTGRLVIVDSKWEHQRSQEA